MAGVDSRSDGSNSSGIVPGGGPSPELPWAPQPAMLPAGTGTKVATPATASVVVAGMTFNVTTSVSGPPGRARFVPPAEPVPPVAFHDVVTGIENVSRPVNVGVRVACRYNFRY